MNAVPRHLDRTMASPPPTGHPLPSQSTKLFPQPPAIHARRPAARLPASSASSASAAAAGDSSRAHLGPRAVDRCRFPIPALPVPRRDVPQGVGEQRVGLDVRPHRGLVSDVAVPPPGAPPHPLQRQRAGPGRAHRHALVALRRAAAAKAVPQVPAPVPVPGVSLMQVAFQRGHHRVDHEGLRGRERCTAPPRWS